MTPQSTIILIGPERVGKSTIGKLLAAKLALPFTDLHETASQYFEEAGYSWETANQAWYDGGFHGFVNYLAPIETHALERVLQTQSTGVFELKATQIGVEDNNLLARIQQALQPYRHVVLLLPSPDVEESILLLDERGIVWFDGLELNEHFVRHHSNHDLAKICHYSQGKTPQESCSEIEQQLDPSAAEVFLIGPIGAGKSTLGKLLAERLVRPQVSLDEIRWEYYKEIGFDEAAQREIGEREGFAGVYRYWKRFEAHAVERALQEHRGCVMDFGAGHSVYEDDTLFARIQTLLAPHPNVAMILPSPDLDEAVAVLRARNTPKIGNVPLTRYLVTHPAYRTLATQVVYTQGKTPEEICAEIMRSIPHNQI